MKEKIIETLLTIYRRILGIVFLVVGIGLIIVCFVLSTKFGISVIEWLGFNIN